MNSFLSPFRIVLCFLVFALLGIFVIPFLKVELNPSPKLHSLTVRFSLSNSSPEIVENQATAPLENTLSSITNLKEINSISNYNQGQITLKFDKETDLQLKKFEVSMLIRQIYPTLISSLSYPLVEVSDGSNKQEKTPSLTYSINAPFSAFEIKNKLESTIKPYFSSISEIEEVEIKTPSNQILKIKYNQDKLNTYNLSEQKLKNQLQTIIETSYLGFYPSTNNTTNFWVQVPPSFSVSDLDNLILSQKPLIRFSDVATSDFEEDIPTSFYRINGKQAITLLFFVRSEANKIKVVNEIKSKLESLNLPKEYQVFKEYDETEYLEKELDKTYKRAFLSVLILCFFILLLERNIKYLFVLLSSLVVNILITVLFAYFLKINIHLYSLAGIAISFGLILDNAIVMLNELHYNYKNKNSNTTIKKQTITNLFLALFAASLTTISALLLIFFLPEEDQKNLLDFAAIVALTIFVSLPIALWFTPSLYSLLFKNSRQLPSYSKSIFKYKKKRFTFCIFKGYIFIIEFLRRFKKAVIFGLILLFGTPIFLLPSKIETSTFYTNFYNQTIGSKLYQEEIRPHSDAYLGGMLRLFVRYAYEKFSYREAEQVQLYIQAKMPKGTTILQMNEALKTVEDFLKHENSANQNIAKFVTQIYTRQGRIIISFSEKEEKTNYPIQLKNKIIARSIDLDGVKWNIYGVGHQGFSTPDQTKLTSFRVQLKGYNYLQVEQEANKLAQKLLAHKRIQEVNINERNSYFEKSDKIFFLNPKLKKLAYQNQSIFDLNNFLEQKTPSAYSEMYLPYQNGFIPTKIEDEKANSFSLYDLKNGNLKNSEIQIPFSTFSTLQTQVSANSIYKENRQYLRIVGYDYFGSEHFGQAHLDKTLKEFEPTLPLGYSFKQLENNFYFSPEKVQKQYGLLGILMLLIFFICSILFESLRQAFLILCVVPLSFIGIFITFGEFQIYFDQGGYASFVLVGGLCVNASIFIINDYNFLKKQRNNRNAFYKATFKKIFPILLTVISTFLGLTPFLWEGQSEIFWFSLAAGTTGGLIFSLFCVFFVLPIFFIKEK
ncbi:cation/multidrug efflux pump [Bernardetia litoralis DSM 6794]|uniref:Cation/multidrug efflux pump n=1 Tax=Bernardetia litoralis (strain ATCC 23117 / DSM 6794 / NBRC 15988 / NCIMB 1366 / Fx l1 / Sio-4) TaxID=880071 RepID=I4AMV6_BERLS|nr:efflux RND transporter permease subunit [Bernardetia litoralis]AFM05291.1 cation/multidrug efflux pump [Bernardetia litoralis DSM 6794]